MPVFADRPAAEGLMSAEGFWPDAGAEGLMPAADFESAGLRPEMLLAEDFSGLSGFTAPSCAAPLSFCSCSWSFTDAGNGL
jgi:hypothetical protein